MRRKFEHFLDEKMRIEDESFMFRKLSKSHLASITKTVADFGTGGGDASTFDTSTSAAKMGKSVWLKYQRLRRVIMNEDIPLWNQLIKKNSGLQMADMVLLFRKKKYYDAVKKLISSKKFQGDVDEAPSDRVVDDDEEGDVPTAEGNNDLLTQKDIEKHSFLVSFPEDYYPPSFWAFKLFGPPAAPYDSPVFRAQISNGPNPKNAAPPPPTASSTSLIMTAGDGPIDHSDRTMPLSRAELKNNDRQAKINAVDHKVEEN
jgi:hypothetical protein